jgi:ribosomal-protein-alanine N-acetyltransferase
VNIIFFQGDFLKTANVLFCCMLQVNFHPFPVLETDRLLLRSLRPADRQELFEIRSNEETMRYIPRPLAKTLEDADAIIDMINGFVERNERINWAITEKGRDKLIGVIGYVKILPESLRAEIGYVLHTDYLQKGYGFEALNAALRYGFATMRLHSVEAIIRPDNNASIRLVQKAGFIKEAYFRDYVFHEGNFYDEEVYSLLAPEV